MMDSIALSTIPFWILVLMLSFVCQGIVSDMGKTSSTSLQNHFATTISSHFTTRNNTKVIAQRGGLAILPCAVKQSSPATVSWIRRRDFQLLTVGLSTHSSDARFLVEHTRHMGHWSLRIKSVREEDRGLYECQLSIYPTQSILIELKVVEAIAEINGAPDLHIDEGSTLRLECKLRRATENPAFVFWYHDNKMVNYDTQGGFSVSSLNTVNMPNMSALDAKPNITNMLVKSFSHYTQPFLISSSVSVLTIKEVHFNHAGNYTCAPSNAKSASINVHVLQGEKPAAMQHANRSTIDEAKSNSSFRHYKQQTNQEQTIFLLIVLFIIYMHYIINR